MPYYDVQVTIPTADNVAANYASNTWHFNADDLTALQLCFNGLKTFYNALTTSFSDMVRRTNWEIKGYDDSDPMPRYPVLTEIFTLTGTPSGAPSPPEIALCMSFQGSKISGVPQAQRRGRVYLPYFDASTIHTDGRPTAGLTGTVAAAGDTLVTASKAATTWKWVTSSQVAPGYAQVLDGWVDNEWDVQRRRGRIATARDVFS